MRSVRPRGIILVGIGASEGVSLSVSSSSLVRLGSLAAVMAAVLLLTAEIIDAYQSAELNREYLTTGTHAFQSVLRLIALGLLLLGLRDIFGARSAGLEPATF